uniref:LRRCT domain-containing protein n=1 Tax=Seriola lalandi dorsalis TaxID=1841481 RepID=A0A3B4WSG7_SERLL
MDTFNFLAGLCFFLLSLNGFISSSPATSFCPDRCDCQHPQHLMCTNRGLRTLPKPAIGLVRLNLQYNQIQTIHPKAFEKLSKLEELYLGHNLLSNVPTGTLQPLKKLTILYGNNNNIKKITPELFANLDNLVKLRLDGNSIEVLQDSVFKSLTSLHYLHLESNQLQHIHRNAFSKLANLRFLNLAHNKQSAVRNVLTFSQLKALTTLLLSENEIQYIGNHVFQNLKKLSKLLKNNFLTSLSGDIFALNNVLYDLDLHGNNWTCDCRLEELKRWMTAAHSQGKLLTVFVQCHYPATLRGKYLDYMLLSGHRDSCQSKSLILCGLSIL